MPLRGSGCARLFMRSRASVYIHDAMLAGSISVDAASGEGVYCTDALRDFVRGAAFKFELVTDFNDSAHQAFVLAFIHA